MVRSRSLIDLFLLSRFVSRSQYSREGMELTSWSTMGEESKKTDRKSQGR